MSTNKILLGSLVLNLGLAGAAVYVFQKPTVAPAPIQTATAAGKRSSPETNPPASEPSVPVREIQSTNNVPEASAEFLWRQLEARDFKTYISNLRSVDCPEETIRDIITAEVNKIYAKRIRAVRQASQSEHPYWETTRNPWNPKKYYEQQKQIHAIEKEKSALLIELLGVDPNEELKETQYVDYWERSYQFLPEEKRDAVAEIQMKYQQQEQDIYGGGGMIDDEDQKKIRELYKQRLTELATILTPDELSEYDIRASHVASQLRYDLESFNPSEDEFRKIYAIRNARHEDLAGYYDQEDKVARDRREKAMKETDEQIKALLGEERFALYKRSPDWNYRQLVRIAERQELPRENVDKVYDMKKEVEDSAAKIRSNSELTQAQKTEALKNLRADTEKGITDSLGEKGWKRYKESQGWWLNNIAPQERTK